MARKRTGPASRWYQSLYWRIGIGALAVDLASLLEREPNANLPTALRARDAGGPPVYAVMTDGVTASNADVPLEPAIARAVEAMLGGY